MSIEALRNKWKATIRQLETQAPKNIDAHQFRVALSRCITPRNVPIGDFLTLRTKVDNGINIHQWYVGDVLVDDSHPKVQEYHRMVFDNTIIKHPTPDQMGVDMSKLTKVHH